MTKSVRIGNTGLAARPKSGWTRSNSTEGRSMGIPKDFKELLELLNAHKVEYLIVGAYALAFYGAPRFTGDLDILVKPDKDNAQKVLDVLVEFGFGSLKLSVEDFSQPDTVIQLGFPPLRIDILTALTGVTWEQIEAGKTTGKLDVAPVFFIGKKEFIQNKRTLGRKKDLADIEAIEE
jgi:hypothetical protein